MNIDYQKHPLPKRLRHHTSPNLYLPIDELKLASDFYPPVYSSIDWKEHFADGKPPNVLDVGCGKGSLLLNYSSNYPDENILGVELRPGPVNWLEKIIQSEQIDNCSVIWYSVVNGLSFIEDNSIAKIIYLFPDPWTKRKHQKRRAFDMDFLKECWRVLRQNGLLFLATDIIKVDVYQKKILKEHNGYSLKVMDNGEEWELPVSNKEKFCREYNVPFFRTICQKKI